jgi:DNA transformation protein
LGSEFESFLHDLLAPLGGVRFRRMFGGHGIYQHDLMFAIVGDGALYFKADAASRGAFEAEGCGPFLYESRGRTVALSYWQVPERLFDEADELREWALVAIGAAQRARTSSGRPGKKGGTGKASKPPSR